MSTVTWANRNKPGYRDYLQQEDKFYLLLEDGFRIILRQTDWGNRTVPSTTWSNRSQPSATWTNRTKPSVDFTP